VVSSSTGTLSSEHQNNFKTSSNKASSNELFSKNLTRCDIRGIASEHQQDKLSHALCFSNCIRASGQQRGQEQHTLQYFFNQGYRISTTGQAAPKFTVKLFYQGRQHNNSKASIAKLYSYSLNRIKI
jgi:hypothetical protein